MLRRYVDLPRAVHILCLGTFINRAGSFLIPFLTIYLTKRLNLDAEFATRAMGLYGFGAILAAMTGGHLADQIGRRGVMIFSLLGGATCVASFGYLSSPRVILAAVVVTAIVAEMYRPAAAAMIADLVGPEQRPHAYGLMYVAINLGFAFGPLIGGRVSERYSFRMLFWGDALTSAIYATIIFAAIRETLAHRQSDSKGAAPAGAAVTHDATQASVSMVQAARYILRDGTFLVFCTATLLMGLVYMQSMSTLPLVLQQLGFGARDFGTTISINGWMIVFLQLPLTAWMSRYDRANVIVVAAAVVACGFGLTAMARTLPQFAMTIAVWTVGEMLQAPLMSAIITDLAPPRMRARYFGMLGVCYSGANMIGAPLGGLVLSRIGAEYVWRATLSLALLAGVLYACIHRRISRKPARLVARERAADAEARNLSS